MSIKQWNAEHARILRACARGALTKNRAGRWVITDETARPTTADREALLYGGYITWPGGGWSGKPITPASLTVDGRGALGEINANPAFRSGSVAEPSGENAADPADNSSRGDAVTGSALPLPNNSQDRA